MGSTQLAPFGAECTAISLFGQSPHSFVGQNLIKSTKWSVICLAPIDRIRAIGLLQLLHLEFQISPDLNLKLTPCILLTRDYETRRNWVNSL